ncbi:MAG: Dihydropteroate synthase [Pseudomonadota bacterium]|jgi:dihydropteroate synthase
MDTFFKMTSSVWQTSRFKIDLTQPKVMAIVNLTPDSFSDGGQHATLKQALDHAQMVLEQGADILDIGGESSRPGAKAVSVQEELDRIGPFLQEAVRWHVPLSVDTAKPEVMKAALEMGADIINDIWALRQPGAVEVVAQHANCGVCLMHMHREPQTMHEQPMQGDAVATVKDFLLHRLQFMSEVGIAQDRIVLDPGIGFGKTIAQNLSLLKHQAKLLTLQRPLLAGWSRKGSLGRLTAVNGVVPVAQQRVGASVAAALMAVQNGALVVRVHDVQETVQALRFWQAAKP